MPQDCAGKLRRHTRRVKTVAVIGASTDRSKFGNKAVRAYAQRGFTVSELSASKLQDRWGKIHARQVHPSLWDAKRFQLSELGRRYLMPIFNQAIGRDDVEAMYAKLFNPANLVMRYQSFNVEIQKRVQYLD